jgi:hypothetical protein
MNVKSVNNLELSILPRLPKFITLKALRKNSYEIFSKNCKTNPIFPHFSPKKDDFTKKQTQYKPNQTQFWPKNQGGKPKQTQFKANFGELSMVNYENKPKNKFILEVIPKCYPLGLQ